MATTVLAEALGPSIAKRAEQIIQATKTQSIPVVAMRKSRLRPILSTKKTGASRNNDICDLEDAVDEKLRG